MPYYCVNKNEQANGDHEVHQTTPSVCHHLPEPSNRLALGEHATCHGAVREAKKTYAKADGCYYCCPDCNTG